MWTLLSVSAIDSQSVWAESIRGIGGTPKSLPGQSHGTLTLQAGSQRMIIVFIDASTSLPDIEALTDGLPPFAILTSAQDAANAAALAVSGAVPVLAFPPSATALHGTLTGFMRGLQFGAERSGPAVPQIYFETAVAGALKLGVDGVASEVSEFGGSAGWWRAVDACAEHPFRAVAVTDRYFE